MVTGLILGSMKHRNICIAIFFLFWRKPDGRTVCGFSTWICTGVDEARGVSHVPCLSCLFFFMLLLGRSLNEQLPSLPALSLHQTPPPPTPISSCEKAQFCLSLPKRKHITKCKPVAPPETTGLLSDCSVVTNSQTQWPEKFKKLKSGWMKMFARHYCCIPLSMRLATAPVYSPKKPHRTKRTGLVGTFNCLNSEMADKFLYSLNVLYYCF